MICEHEWCEGICIKCGESAIDHIAELEARLALAEKVCGSATLFLEFAINSGYHSYGSERVHREEQVLAADLAAWMAQK